MDRSMLVQAESDRGDGYVPSKTLGVHQDG